MVYTVLSHKTSNIHDFFRIGRALGQGIWGATHVCTEIDTGIKYACKLVLKSSLTCEDDVDELRNEIQIMHYLSNHVQNVVKIKSAYEDDSYVYTVVELCSGGKLSDMPRPCNERKAAELVKIIVGVVEACHELGVMNRNLSLDNFMFAREGDELSLKLIDFESSVFFEPGQVFAEMVGSPHYDAPEVVLNNYGPEVDVWSAGVILYTLLSGTVPFPGGTEEEVYREVLDGYIDFESHPWHRISDSAKDLISKMLCSRPSKRWTPHQVLLHPWLCENGVARYSAMNPAFSRLTIDSKGDIDNSDADECGGSTAGYQYYVEDGSESGALIVQSQKANHQRASDYLWLQPLDQNYDGECKLFERDDGEECDNSVDSITRLACENEELRAVNKNLSCKYDALQREVTKNLMFENDTLREVVKNLTTEKATAAKDRNQESRDATSQVEPKTWFEIGSISLGPYLNVKNLIWKRK